MPVLLRRWPQRARARPRAITDRARTPSPASTASAPHASSSTRARAPPPAGSVPKRCLGLGPGLLKAIGFGMANFGIFFFFFSMPVRARFVRSYVCFKCDVSRIFSRKMTLCTPHQRTLRATTNSSTRVTRWPSKRSSSRAGKNSACFRPVTRVQKQRDPNAIYLHSAPSQR